MFMNQATGDCLLYSCHMSMRLPAIFCPACSARVCCPFCSAQNSSAVFAFGWPLGLLGALARLEGLFSALPFGLAVGGVLTSAGGTGPPFAKYKFLFKANFTCKIHPNGAFKISGQKTQCMDMHPWQHTTVPAPGQSRLVSDI